MGTRPKGQGQRPQRGVSFRGTAHVLLAQAWELAGTPDGDPETWLSAAPASTAHKNCSGWPLSAGQTLGSLVSNLSLETQSQMLQACRDPQCRLTDVQSTLPAARCVLSWQVTNLRCCGEVPRKENAKRLPEPQRRLGRGATLRLGGEGPGKHGRD